jgi:response regulator RpfG family c-di-GMP phosphodiesterase
MHLSAKLGYSKDNVLDVGLAALFHDIGKMYISSEILKKKSKLTEHEFSKKKNPNKISPKAIINLLNPLFVVNLIIARSIIRPDHVDVFV